MAPSDSIRNLKNQIGQTVLGQEAMVERLLIGLLANGNLLVEGLPGLAKTRAVKKLSKFLDAGLSRIQFTPDLLPSDITGSEVYYTAEGKGEFRFQPGPVFNNLVLADEINRAPAKVQAALLEAMEERHVTVAGTTHNLPPLFLVMATQNPIEQEGTYPLPEAQLDRFLMHVYVDYPEEKSERDIMLLVRNEEQSDEPAGPAV
ncbi:MAG TPA: AAA family ATPase, partial [Edaphobacter sp.]|nr:AAA family ATPase [Edaphobacter sp.]